MNSRRFQPADGRALRVSTLKGLPASRAAPPGPVAYLAADSVGFTYGYSRFPASREVPEWRAKLLILTPMPRPPSPLGPLARQVVARLGHSFTMVGTVASRSVAYCGSGFYKSGTLCVGMSFSPYMLL